MLLVEQNLQVVRDLAHTVVVLSGGRVVHTGPAAEFLDSEPRCTATSASRPTAGGRVSTDPAAAHHRRRASARSTSWSPAASR